MASKMAILGKEGQKQGGELRENTGCELRVIIDV
jgi:hypothetical protein